MGLSEFYRYKMMSYIKDSKMDKNNNDSQNNNNSQK